MDPRFALDRWVLRAVQALMLAALGALALVVVSLRPWRALLVFVLLALVPLYAMAALQRASRATTNLGGSRGA
jgi:hypothetical protein